MRPRRFILPQAGTGGYGIRPYVFEAAEHQHRGGAPRGVFSLWPKTKSVGAHSICDAPAEVYPAASGYGRAMLAPTNVFWQSKPEIFLPAARFSPPPPAGGAPSQRGPREGGAPRGVFSLWPKTKSVGAHSICDAPAEVYPAASGYGRAMLAPTNVFWQSKPEIFLPAARFSPPPPAGGAPSQRGPREGGAPRGAFSLCRKRNP